jgi:hypothetical protein
MYDGRKDTEFKGSAKYKLTTETEARVGGERWPTCVNGQKKRNLRTVWVLNTGSYKGTHYAAYPPTLPEPCILAGTSEKGVCPECGAPWERVVIKGEQERHESEAQTIGAGRGHGGDRSKHAIPAEVIDEYWQPTCECGIEETIPATVLDPFIGSGTTCMVARKHGRNAIGLDLNFEYLNTDARKRLQYGDFIPVADGISQLTLGVGQ